MRLATIVGALLNIALCNSNVFASTMGLDDFELPQNGCSFAGMFEQSKQFDGLEFPLISSGVFYYNCQAGVIWKTDFPISETLIFKRDGTTYTVQDNKLTQLKSRPIKTLGRVLNSLIGGDRQGLSELFVISQAIKELDLGQQLTFITLTPRKRNMRRGLKKIELEFPSAQDDTQKWVKISIQDRRGEWARILASTKDSYRGMDPALDQCTAVKTLTKKACEQLFNELATLSKSVSPQPY